MSLTIQKSVSLLEFNTFSVPSVAEYFCRVTDKADVLEAIDFAKAQDLPITILGGGSNVVLQGHIKGLCLYVAVKGMSITGDVYVLGAGENWHDAVVFSLSKGLSGLENLGLIPGQAGAAPIQNIGAYGVELSQVLQSVSGIDLATGREFELSKEQCAFGYRDSVFKKAQGAHLLILSVSLKLDQGFSPKIEYTGIREQLSTRLGVAAKNVHRSVKAEDVFNVVCDLRRRKLPDPKVKGNAGSFFKNPVLGHQAFQRLQSEFLELTGHKVLNKEGNEGMKVSAAFLIDKAGLKGLSLGGASVSSQHALVLENTGSATGEDVVELASLVREKIKTRFEIDLEVEPRFIPPLAEY